MDRSVTAGHQRNPDSDEATWRGELASLLGPTTFPCTGQDATVNLLRAHAPSRLLWRLNAAPPQLRFTSLDLLIAYIDAHSNRRPQYPVDVSPIDDTDRDDVLVQLIIDNLVKSSRGRPHAQVVSELAERIAEQNLPARPQPWLDAVADEAINGNAYVVNATTALAYRVREPSTDRPGKSIK